MLVYVLSILGVVFGIIGTLLTGVATLIKTINKKS